MKIFFTLFAIIFSLVSFAKESITIETFTCPSNMINKQTDYKTLTDKTLWIEVCDNKENIIARTNGLALGGNKEVFSFSENVEFDNFPIIVKVMTGESKSYEKGARALAGAGIGATIGGIIGGCCAGFVTGGLGAPAGAAIGIAIGGAVGGASSFLVPVEGSKELTSFRFEKKAEVCPQEKPCGIGDILLDGKVMKLVVK